MRRIPPSLLSGTFEVELYARPGQKLDELVKIADAEIERLKKEGPTAAEVRKAQNERESALIMGLQSVTRKASVLNQYMATLGDPLAYRTELDKVFAVTPADVVSGGEEVPGPDSDRARRSSRRPRHRDPPKPPSTPSKQAALADPPLAVSSRRIRPVDHARARSTAPAMSRHRSSGARLSNGLELRIVERHDLPIVTFDLIVKSGETLTPKGKEGLASIAASLLDEGTKTRDALQMAGELAEIGASLGTDGELESTTVSLTTLTRHLDHALDLYADVILNPSFPEKELDRLKLQRLAATQGPGRRPGADRRGRVPAIDLRAGPSLRPPRPGDARLGPIDHARRCGRVLQADHGAGQRRAGGRRRRPARADHRRARSAACAPGRPARSRRSRRSPHPARPHPRTGPIYLIDKPAAAQSVLTVGGSVPPASRPIISALTLMNAILGGQFCQPDQHEPSRGQGLQLRGSVELFVLARPRAVRGRRARFRPR